MLKPEYKLAEECEAHIRGGYALIDIRPSQVYSRGHHPSSHDVPFTNAGFLRALSKNLPRHPTGVILPNNAYDDDATEAGRAITNAGLSCIIIIGGADSYMDFGASLDCLDY